MNNDDLDRHLRATSNKLSISDTAIVEKDYYVVKLLNEISLIHNDYYDIIFSGGTSLTKMGIGINRISEDVDIKLTPKQAYHDLSGNQKRKALKGVRGQILECITQMEGLDALTDQSITRDTGRYYQLPVSYKNMYEAPKYMREDIKLELVETDLLAPASLIPISSIVAETNGFPAELDSILVSNLVATQAEKILSLLRRTAAHSRDNSRQDDETLTRHVYDCHFLSKINEGKSEALSEIFNKAVLLDIERYGNQSDQFKSDPVSELRFGLDIVENDDKYKNRYEKNVTPLVYGERVSWNDAFTTFKENTLLLIEGLSSALGKDFDPDARLAAIREKTKLTNTGNAKP